MIIIYNLYCVDCEKRNRPVSSHRNKLRYSSTD